MRWLISSKVRRFAVDAEDADDLAAQIHRRYQNVMGRPFLVIVDINERMQPTGAGAVLDDITRQPLDAFRLRPQWASAVPA